MKANILSYSIKLIIFITVSLSLLFILIFTSIRNDGDNIVSFVGNVDMGEIKKGEIIEHEFILTNNSNKPIKIKKIQKSCVCTSAEVSNNLIEPFGTVGITVSFDTTEQIGNINVQNSVIFDSVDIEPIKLNILAFVYSIGPEFSHRIIYVDDMSAGEERLKFIKIFNQKVKGSEWFISKVTSSSPNIIAKYDESNAEIECKIISNDSSGSSLCEEIVVTVFYPKIQESKDIFIPITANITSKLIIKPNKLYLGVVSPGQKCLVSFKILNSGINYKFIDSKHHSVDMGNKNDDYVLYNATITVPSNTGYFTGEIKIDSESDKRILPIKYSGLVRNG